MTKLIQIITLFVDTNLIIIISNLSNQVLMNLPGGWDKIREDGEYAAFKLLYPLYTLSLLFLFLHSREHTSLGCGMYSPFDMSIIYIIIICNVKLAYQ